MIDMWDKTTYTWNAVANYRTATVTVETATALGQKTLAVKSFCCDIVKRTFAYLPLMDKM